MCEAFNNTITLLFPYSINQSQNQIAMNIFKNMLDRILETEKGSLPLAHKELEQIKIDKAKYDTFRATSSIMV